MEQLPDKWFIIRTKENAEDVNKYECDRQGNPGAAFLQDGAYFYSDKKYSTLHNTAGYTEITHEQFRNFVLSKKTEGVIYNNYSLF